jgi:hypothetical protein
MRQEVKNTSCTHKLIKTVEICLRQKKKRRKEKERKLNVKHPLGIISRNVVSPAFDV